MRSEYFSDASFFQCIYSKRKHLGTKDSPLQIKEIKNVIYSSDLFLPFLNSIGERFVIRLKNLLKLLCELKPKNSAT